MKKHFKYIAVVSVALIASVALYFYPSKYDRLMSDAIKVQKEHPEQKVFDGEVEPSMPNKDKNDKTILGIDTNKNGIRDDVDIWINRTGIDYNERMAMRQFARTKQDIFKVCKNLNYDKMTLNEIAKANYQISEVLVASSYAKTCLAAVSDFNRSKDYVFSRLQKLLENNHVRNYCIVEIHKFNFPFTLEVREFHKDCNFKIENEQIVIKKYKSFWGYTK